MFGLKKNIAQDIVHTKNIMRKLKVRKKIYIQKIAQLLTPLKKNKGPFLIKNVVNSACRFQMSRD